MLTLEDRTQEPIQAATQLAALNALDAERLLQWAWNEHYQRVAIFTSFQNTGCVMIDMAHRLVPDLRVITVDTLRLPQETYDLMDVLEQRYGITIERFKPDAQRLDKMLQDHGEYLFFDSREKQEYCCTLRKVEPNTRALNSVDLWITGLRRDQSKARGAIPKVAVMNHAERKIVKLAPLIDWSEKQVWDYIHENNVPYNALYDKGYTSIGCYICSTPTRPGEDKRAGRWRWMNQLNEDQHKECGLHLNGSGI